jgi:hypothetical protein
LTNHARLIEKCHEAFWSFPDDPLSSNKRIAAVFEAIATDALADCSYLAQIARKILMPDIAMCNGDDCPVKENCWRYLAPPDRFQSYFAAPPRNEEGCEYFWDVNEK